MSTKEAKNDVAVEKIAENDVADAKADLKGGTKRTADVSLFSFDLPKWFYFLLSDHRRRFKTYFFLLRIFLNTSFQLFFFFSIYIIYSVWAVDNKISIN